MSRDPRICFDPESPPISLDHRLARLALRGESYPALTEEWIEETRLHVRAFGFWRFIWWYFCMGEHGTEHDNNY